MKLFLCVSLQIIILLISGSMFSDATYTCSMTGNTSMYFLAGTTVFGLEILYVFIALLIYGKLDI